MADALWAGRAVRARRDSAFAQTGGGRSLRGNRSSGPRAIEKSRQDSESAGESRSGQGIGQRQSRFAEGRRLSPGIAQAGRHDFRGGLRARKVPRRKTPPRSRPRLAFVAAAFRGGRLRCAAQALLPVLLGFLALVGAVLARPALGVRTRASTFS